MQDLKISLITVVYNAETTIGRCIESIISQNFKNVEYIIIDACSTDKTKQIISQYSNYITAFRSDPDSGIYDAMNKGIKLAHGDVIGILNADDFFADNGVLDAIANAFINQDSDIVYADLDYVNPGGKIIRKWRSDAYTQGMFNWGWMPPHPTFYCKAGLFKKFGDYKPAYGTAADYELMLRFMHVHRASSFHVNKVAVKMTIGGVSNKSYMNRLQALVNDAKAMRNNDILFPLLTSLCKPLRKLFQFF
ncbi:MAG: glycosyltransferase family 2 protein [Mucilaginibacter sp.]